MITVCYQCVKRYVGCHANCKEWHDQQIEIKNQKQKIADAKRMDNLMRFKPYRDKLTGKLMGWNGEVIG